MPIPKALRQEVRQLKQRSVRWDVGKIVVEGEKCIRELCESLWEVERIYFTPSWNGSNFWDSSNALNEVERLEVSNKDMEMMSSLKTPPGLLAVARMPSSIDQLPPENGMILYLDGLADPGNLGTLIRVVDWFGLSGIIASRQCADFLSPKAIQSAMGSTFHVSTCFRDFDELPTSMTSCVVGLEAGGENLFLPSEVPWPTLLVVGSESHGISEGIREACHAFAAIPGSGRAESLNASVAGSIAIASFLQQRMP